MKLITTILILALTGAMTPAQPVIVENGPASSTVTISVTIPKKAKIESVDQHRFIYVSAEDVRKGFKEIPNAVSLHVWANSRDGYYLQHRISKFIDGSGAAPSGMLVLLTVTGSTDIQPVGPEFQYIYQGHPPISNREVVQITLKLVLAPQTKPGLYTLESDFTADCL